MNRTYEYDYEIVVYNVPKNCVGSLLLIFQDVLDKEADVFAMNGTAVFQGKLSSNEMDNLLHERVKTAVVKLLPEAKVVSRWRYFKEFRSE